MKNPFPHQRTYVASIPVNALPIPEFPGYFATPDGCIYSLFGRAKRRKFGRNSCGYPICGMKNKEGEVKFPMVHRVIAMLFVHGDKALEVNHIDMNKENSRADNLEWVTKRDNHRKGRALNPEWSDKIKDKVSRALVAEDAVTGEIRRFVSGRAAALWVGKANAAGNISKACGQARIAYGCFWNKA